MAASRTDQAALSVDPVFQNRVRQSLVAAGIAISSEGWAMPTLHQQRMRQVVAIMNAPDTYKTMYAIAVVTDANVISDATQAGTVALGGLTAGQVATQAALVTDAHIDNAVSAMFNAFFMPI